MNINGSLYHGLAANGRAGPFVDFGGGVNLLTGSRRNRTGQGRQIIFMRMVQKVTRLSKPPSLVCCLVSLSPSRPAAAVETQSAQLYRNDKMAPATEPIVLSTLPTLVPPPPLLCC